MMNDSHLNPLWMCSLTTHQHLMIEHKMTTFLMRNLSPGVYNNARQIFHDDEAGTTFRIFKGQTDPVSDQLVITVEHLASVVPQVSPIQHSFKTNAVYSHACAYKFCLHLLSHIINCVSASQACAAPLIPWDRLISDMDIIFKHLKSLLLLQRSWKATNKNCPLSWNRFNTERM